MITLGIFNLIAALVCFAFMVYYVRTRMVPSAVIVGVVGLFNFLAGLNTLGAF